MSQFEITEMLIAALKKINLLCRVSYCNFRYTFVPYSDRIHSAVFTIHSIVLLFRICLKLKKN